MPKALRSASDIGFTSTQLCDMACFGIRPMFLNVMRSVSPGLARSSVTLNFIVSSPVISIARLPSAVGAGAAGALATAAGLSDRPQPVKARLAAASVGRRKRVQIFIVHDLSIRTDNDP